MEILINLLPWRHVQEKRVQRMWVGILVFGIIGIGCIYILTQSKMEEQFQREREHQALLKQEIAQIGQEISHPLEQEVESAITFPAKPDASPLTLLAVLQESLSDGVQMYRMHYQEDELQLEGTARSAVSMTEWLGKMEQKMSLWQVKVVKFHPEEGKIHFLVRVVRR